MLQPLPDCVPPFLSGMPPLRPCTFAHAQSCSVKSLPQAICQFHWAHILLVSNNSSCPSSKKLCLPHIALPVPFVFFLSHAIQILNIDLPLPLALCHQVTTHTGICVCGKLLSTKWGWDKWVQSNIKVLWPRGHFWGSNNVLLLEPGCICFKKN